ncbi:MAG: endolytic transglycosylase MltG [Oscillospiraceae bacterium]|jgi:UPF0755 protein|nr:endolytic transglycosylase MltG [Oscillospiraceae bacterium]
MDDKKNTPNNQNPEEQHTRQFDAIITPNTGNRNILRPDQNRRPPQDRDVYVSQNKKPGNGDGSYIMRPPAASGGNQPGSETPGGSIPVSKKAQPSRSASVQGRPVSKAPAAPAGARGAQSPIANEAAVKRAPQAKRPARQAASQAGAESAEAKKRNLILISTLITFILAAATILTAYGITSLNDILAISRSSDKISILVTENMSTNDIIAKLEEKDLIKNAGFCKLFAKFMNYDEYTYPPAVYELRPNMGLEGMLRTLRATSTSNETVTLVFPEGYTVDQIFAKLEKFEVCSASSLYSTLSEVDFSSEFSFIKAIGNKAERYRYMEGYLYPDTYNFYIGENASSVIKKFLANFKTKWSDEYIAKAKELNMTVDQIITLASIIEKEGKNSDQMATISGILHNRLADKTGSLSMLGCDSTYGYIMNIDKKLLSTDQYDRLFAAFNTYQIKGLPPGPICNPGDDAIYAALYPEDTSYSYFRHDKAGKMYLAKTLAEHNANEKKVNEANAALPDE